MELDKVVPENVLAGYCIETQGLMAAVLDVLPNGEKKIVKSEDFDEEESYAIVGEGYVPVGYWLPWAKIKKLRTKEEMLSPNTLYQFFPLRQSLVSKEKLNPSAEIREQF